MLFRSKYAREAVNAALEKERANEVVLGYGKHGGEWFIKWPREDISGKTGSLIFREEGK